MINLKNNYIKIPDDIKFLLDFCRDLMRKIKEDNPNKVVPINSEQLTRLRNIEKIYTR